MASGDKLARAPIYSVDVYGLKETKTKESSMLLIEHYFL